MWLNNLAQTKQTLTQDGKGEKERVDKSLMGSYFLTVKIGTLYFTFISGEWLCSELGCRQTAADFIQSLNSSQIHSSYPCLQECRQLGCRFSSFILDVTMM